MDNVDHAAMTGLQILLVLAIGTTLDSLEDIYKRGNDGTRSVVASLIIAMCLIWLGHALGLSTITRLRPASLAA